MAGYRVPETGENGYALIGVIWLLLFAGSVTAFLMMRASDDMAATNREAELVRGQLALEGAFDAIAAERLFAGAGSPWMTAGTHSLDMDGVAVSATLSSEERRLDVSRADPQAIDAALLTAGVPRQTRTTTIGRIVEARSGEGGMASLPALASILREAQAQARGCLLDSLTVFGGLRQMRTEQDGQEAAQLPPYALARIRVAANHGGVATAIMRSVPVGAQPVLLLDWQAGDPCQAGIS